MEKKASKRHQVNRMHLICRCSEEFNLRGKHDAMSTVELLRARRHYKCRFWDELVKYVHANCGTTRKRTTGKLTFKEFSKQKVQQANSGLISEVLSSPIGLFLEPRARTPPSSQEALTPHSDRMATTPSPAVALNEAKTLVDDQIPETENIRSPYRKVISPASWKLLDEAEESERGVSASQSEGSDSDSDAPCLIEEIEDEYEEIGGDLNSYTSSDGSDTHVSSEESSNEIDNDLGDSAKVDYPDANKDDGGQSGNDSDSSNGNNDDDSPGDSSDSDDSGIDDVDRQIELKFLGKHWWKYRPFKGPWKRGKGPNSKEFSSLTKTMHIRVNRLAKNHERKVVWHPAKPCEADSNKALQDLAVHRDEIKRLSKWMSHIEGLASFYVGILESYSSRNQVSPIAKSVSGIVESIVNKCTPAERLKLEPIINQHKPVLLPALRTQLNRDTPLRTCEVGVPVARGQLTEKVSFTMRSIVVLLDDMIEEQGAANVIQTPQKHKVRGQDVSGSFMQGDLAIEIDRNVKKRFHEKPELVVLHLGIGIDGSPATRKEELVPVTLRILNFPRRIHARCHRLVGYFNSKLKFKNKQTAGSEEAKASKRFALAAQFLFLLDQIAELQEQGPFLVQDLLIYPVVSQFYLDLKEKMALLNLSLGYNHCPNCYARKPFLDDFTSLTLRNTSTSMKVVEWSRPLFAEINPNATVSMAHSYDSAKRQAKLMFSSTGHYNQGRWEMHPVDSTLNYGHPHGIYGITPPDMMHTLRKGPMVDIFQDISVAIAGDPNISVREIRKSTDIGGNSLEFEVRTKVGSNAKLAYFCGIVNAFKGNSQHLFTGGKEAKEYTSDLHDILTAFLVTRLMTEKEDIPAQDADAVFSIKIVGDAFVKMLGWYLIADSVAKRRETCEVTLQDLDEILCRVQSIATILNKKRKRKGAFSSNNLKNHNLVHIVPFIRKCGNALEMDTEDSEHDHIVNVKRIIGCVKKGPQLALSALRRKIEVDKARQVLSHIIKDNEKVTSWADLFSPNLADEDMFDANAAKCKKADILKTLKKKNAVVNWKNVDDKNVSCAMESVVYVKSCDLDYLYSDSVPKRHNSYSTSKEIPVSRCLYRDQDCNMWVVLCFEVKQLKNGSSKISACVIPMEMQDLPLQTDEAYLRAYIYLCKQFRTEISGTLSTIDLHKLRHVTAKRYSDLFIAYPETGSLFLFETFDKSL